MNAAQVSASLSQSDLSTQVSMVQPLALALDLLQGNNPDAKLSIFDDTLPRADVSPAGVLAKGNIKHIFNNLLRLTTSMAVV